MTEKLLTGMLNLNTKLMESHDFNGYPQQAYFMENQEYLLLIIRYPTYLVLTTCRGMSVVQHVVCACLACRDINCFVQYVGTVA